jgi:hypothetical protein
MYEDEEAKEIEEQNKQKERLALAWGEVAKSPAGQFVLNDLKLICNAENCCVRDIVHPDPNSVLFESGKNSIYNYIMIYVRHYNERRKWQR